MPCLSYANLIISNVGMKTRNALFPAKHQTSDYVLVLGGSKRGQKMTQNIERARERDINKKDLRYYINLYVDYMVGWYIGANLTAAHKIVM